MATPLAPRSTKPAQPIPLSRIDGRLIVEAYNRARPVGAPAWHELRPMQQLQLTAMVVRRATRGGR